MMAQQDGPETAVRPYCCFPWKAPHHYIAIFNLEGRELVLVDDISELDDESRELLQEALEVGAHTLEITRILNIRKQLEIRLWEVEVDGVYRTFQTELDEWPRKMPGGRILIRDVCGDLYSVRSADQLDKNSRFHLWALAE